MLMTRFKLPYDLLQGWIDGLMVFISTESELTSYRL